MKQPRGAPLLYKAAILAAIAFFIPQLSLFKSSTVVRAHSQDMANAALGDSRLLLPQSSEELDTRIVVLLADEQSLTLTGNHWPPDEGYHANVMRELEVYRPAAVFLDFLFMDRRDPDGAEELKKALASLAAPASRGGAGVRTYLPAVDGKTLQGLQFQPREFGDITLVGVNHLVDDGDSITRQYPWYGGPRDEPVASAAVRIFCDRFPDRGLCTGLSKNRFSTPPRTFDLIWNTRPHPFNVRWHPRDCQAKFQPGWRDMALGKWQRVDACPAFATVFVSELFAGASPGQTSPTTEQLIEQLEGAVVMYGSAFEHAGDTIISGVVGELPGTYYHAAALDNLLAFEGEPKMRRALHEGSLWRRSLYYLFLFGLAVLFLFRQRLLARHSLPVSRGPGTLRNSIIRELSKIPVPLVLVPAIVFTLIAATLPSLRMAVLMLLAFIAIMAEILRGSGGRPERIVKRVLIYSGAVLISVLAMLAYGWLSFHVFDEPPLDWFGVTAFITFGWFLAYAAVGDLLDDLWKLRAARVQKQQGDRS